MPSVHHKDNQEPSVLTGDADRHADLQALLREGRAASNGNLNVLYARGKVVFAEGEPARGIYLLRKGRATVSISSGEGRVVMLHLAQAGSVLGLNAVLQNHSYDTTVKTLEPCRTDFISRVELLALMQRSETCSQKITKLLSRELAELTERMKLLMLPQTAGGRLARLLLAWSKGNGCDALWRLDRVFTHEEIAQMIGSSRETVTRLLASLGKQRIISVTSDSILIQDRLALEKIAMGALNVTDVTATMSAKT